MKLRLIRDEEDEEDEVVMRLNDEKGEHFLEGNSRAESMPKIMVDVEPRAARLILEACFRIDSTRQFIPFTQPANAEKTIVNVRARYRK